MADIVDPLIPPYRFERVQNHLYRGGYPKPRNYRFLRRQRLKTILSLIPGAQDDNLVDFCKTNGIKLLAVKVQSPKENVTVTNAIVSQCLELLTDPGHAPLYLHCLDGSNVTGVVVMCLRKLQLWRVASYQNEYLRFEQDGEIIPEESEFVEAYKGEGLVLANPYAQWLWPSRDPVDANALPFERGVHPVLPLVRLRQRMSTDICVADPLCSLSRSATEPALNASDLTGARVDGPAAGTGSTSYASDAQVSVSAGKADADADADAAAGGHRHGAGAVNPRRTVMTHRSISENQHAQPSLDIAPQILTSGARSVRFSTSECTACSFENTPAARALLQTHRRTQSTEKQGAMAAHRSDADGANAGALLHTSLSTGALAKVISGSAPTESDSQTRAGQPAPDAEHRRALDDIHEALEPVLAALARSSDAASSSVAAATAMAATDAASGLSLPESSGNVATTSLQTPAVFPASGKEHAALHSASADGAAAAKIREISLSYTVKALAIEGLGM
ncbi:protein-tyrosine-phosphatase [Coemansia sp. RSA 2598]|nr:protein-tyrosine-phosphatase [Coemansia sp. RSA 2598]